jgi:hypothetical protein
LPQSALPRATRPIFDDAGTHLSASPTCLAFRFAALLCRIVLVGETALGRRFDFQPTCGAPSARGALRSSALYQQSLHLGHPQLCPGEQVLDGLINPAMTQRGAAAVYGPKL